MAPIRDGLLLLCGLALLASQPARGYTCTGLQVCAVPWPNDVLFVGEVVRQGHNSRSDDEPARPTLFRVVEAFHGLAPDGHEVEVWSDSFQHFVEGSRWALDTIRESADDGGRLDTRHCGRSRRLDGPNAESDRKFLDALTARRDGTAPTTVDIYQHAGRQSGVSRVGPVQVRLSGSVTYDFSVPDDGRVFKREIAPGEYAVEILSSRHPFVGDARFIARAGSCNSLGLQFGPLTRISGRVTAPDGTPVPRARITISGSAVEGDEWVEADESGSYELRGVSPGNYTVRANKQGYRETYYLSSAFLSLATLVPVEENAHVEDVDIRLAGELSLAEVSLTILGVDGEPASSMPARVSLLEDFEGKESRSFTVGGETDYAGRVTVTSKVGALLKVTVSAGEAVRLYSRSTEPIAKGEATFVVTEDGQVEKVVLTESFCRNGLQWAPCP